MLKILIESVGAVVETWRAPDVEGDIVFFLVIRAVRVTVPILPVSLDPIYAGYDQGFLLGLMDYHMVTPTGRGGEVMRVVRLATGALGVSAAADSSSVVECAHGDGL